MANIDYKFGEYAIAANTQQAFSFWWADNERTNEYFDVSIAPVHNKDNLEMIPLIEVQRSMVWSIPHHCAILCYSDNSTSK